MLVTFPNHREVQMESIGKGAEGVKLVCMMDWAVFITLKFLAVLGITSGITSCDAA